jgi:hypothetical protein
MNESIAAIVIRLLTIQTINQVVKSCELSALRFTVCDYPFVIFKLFLHIKDNLKHIIANNRMLALVLVDGLQSKYFKGTQDIQYTTNYYTEH